MNPLISVVVPVYKVEQVLHYCIESILRQTYSNFELLLIDDGSPDKSGEICDEYAKKDKRVKVIHKKNEGVSIARNTGFDNAKGEYIVCVDSDDYVDERYLQDFIDVINEYPDAEMIWCGFTTVKDYEKNIIQNVRYDESENLVKTHLSKIMTLRQKWLDASPCTKLYLKKSSIIK
jgi:glycosyltransferase involved in cell wall biosynthesis